MKNEYFWDKLALLECNQNSSPHKSGFISIIGNPNVGKSTLMNALVGKELSIITAKAQTTRHRVLGIINGENFQMVLSDTPGVIKPAYKMQYSMMNFVKEAFIDADVLIYMTAIGESGLKDKTMLNKILKFKSTLIILINKIDLASSQDELEVAVTYLKSEFPRASIYPVSASTGFFVSELLKILIEHLPESPAYFPKDQFTDKPKRFFVNEAIRERILEYYKKEIPYAVEVVTEAFHEEERIIRIRSIILVERETQKGIVIGRRGSALKRVGTEARKSLEDFFGKQIYLELYVKVLKNWRSNPNALKRFGYDD